MLQEERRSSQRHKIKNKIKYSSYKVLEKSEVKQSLSIDVSEGGISFTSESPYQEGALLFVELNLPGWTQEKSGFMRPQRAEYFEPLKVLVRTSWCKKLSKNYRLGVEIANIDPDHHKAFKTFLKKINLESNV